jgi:uncharacterized membrane-anchored protein
VDLGIVDEDVDDLVDDARRRVRERPAGGDSGAQRPRLLGRQSVNTCRSGVVQAPVATLDDMTATAHRGTAAPRLRRMLNKVPEVTLYFWVIKIMCTTVGETAADYLNENLGFGLKNTTYFAGALLVALFAVQFRLRRYVPAVYWAVVVVISVFGTLITDNMTDHYNVPLTTSTIVFAIVLAVVFAVWYSSERTLSIHTIFTTRREAFYWLAILFTFALGTATGDLSAEKLDLGYAVSIGIFGGLIAAVAVAHYAFRMNAVLSFWLAYILTRPLGASIGDEMSQHSHKYGGLGLGTTGTSYIFLGCILALVTFLSITRRDATEHQQGAALAETA